MKRLALPLILSVTAVALFLSSSNSSLAQEKKKKDAKKPAAEEPKAERKPDVIFVPTPQSAVEKMLTMAEVKPTDIVYDLGCGDGRIVVTAAKKYGVKAVGVDIDPQRVKESLANVKENKMEKLVTIKQADIFELDFSEATVVTMYLLPELNVKLMPKLNKLKPGTRVIAWDFDMRGAKPVEIVEHNTDEANGTIYKWVVPFTPE